ncbi:TlpA disulfide reductase family protein [Terrabacter sp. MAHUQ-38]|jgi:thiol-disulfide isomerase/thioredoxin|uniref:TlpA family protein disulfide reductase n=1 Tax=unclassified Terrabacter TaxID=2630222 RepID=UPI00165E4ADE|nr:TlpA disulfide reductase family protein [Terrabacter sp. MAHUQ-38]MBC9822284.1 TlpA family protein disulfide reductase [Terrabacter sp. MAHUQ-38]
MEHLDRRTALRWGAVAVAGGLAAAVSACSSDPNSVADQARSGDRKGYVAGDGSIEQLPATDRGEPVTLSGTTLEGKPWSLAERVGTVLVVNVWGSWCPPCIEETPALQKAWESVQATGKKVEFVGLDKLEGAETGLAFQTANKVTYPSLAYDGGVPLLALQGKASATPTTLVLDHEARIAARVSGPVSTTTLIGLIDDVLAEKA